MKKYKQYIKYLKDFWHYLWHDESLLSYVLNFVFAFIFIKFIFFPGIGLVLDTDYPIVAIVTGSMEHKIVDGRVCNEKFRGDSKLDYDTWWNYCGTYYEDNFDINKSQFYDFDYRNGLNIGDVMILRGKSPDNIDIGDILVFTPQDKVSGDVAKNLGLNEGDSFFLNYYGPVIHRVTDKWKDDEGKWHFSTKGDHNGEMISKHSRLSNQVKFSDFESDIPQEDVIGTSLVRIPYLGYAKIVLSKLFSLLTGGIF